MTEWPNYSVGELQADGVLLVEDGNHGEYRPRPSEFNDNGTAFIRAADLANGQVDFEKAGRINQIALQRIHKGVGRPGDILFSHKGTVGKIARTPADAPAFVCSPQTTFWRVRDESRLDPDYLYSFMQSRRFIEQWWVRKGETDMADYVSLTAQRQLRITVPPLNLQKRISRPLRTLDTLIATNRRRIELLEQMAQAIYREWFVQFRYPGHEDVPLVDSPLGPIPEGWVVGSLGLLAEEVRKAVKPSPATASIPYVPIDAINPRSITLRNSRPGHEAASSLRLFEKGDLLFGAMRAYFHKVCIAPFRGVTRSTCFVLRPSHYPLFTVMTLAQDATVAYAAAHSSGSTIPYAKWAGVLSDMPTVIPPADLAGAFEAVAAPLLEQAQSLVPQAQILERLRDLLLPKLVTGQIDVSELDLDALVESVA